MMSGTWCLTMPDRIEALLRSWTILIYLKKPWQTDGYVKFRCKFTAFYPLNLRYQTGSLATSTSFTRVSMKGSLSMPLILPSRNAESLITWWTTLLKQQVTGNSLDSMINASTSSVITLLLLGKPAIQIISIRRNRLKPKWMLTGSSTSCLHELFSDWLNALTKFNENVM